MVPDLTTRYELYLGFSRSTFEKAVSQELDGRLTWNERDVSWWVYRMLDVLELWPRFWTSEAFKVTFWYSRIPGMGWPIDMERKGCESKGCLTLYVTFDLGITHDFELGFSRKNLEIDVSHEWECQLTWNEKYVSQIQSCTNYATLSSALNHDFTLIFFIFKVKF